jgi:Domain of unknown function (DUF4126)
MVIDCQPLHPSFLKWVRRGYAASLSARFFATADPSFAAKGIPGFLRGVHTYGVRLPGDHLFALLVSVSFAAGLNLYATVATLGLLAHAGVIALPASLNLLDNWYVIGVSCALFALEFVADKIPGFDLAWNALHTFIRVPVAALLAYRATDFLTPFEQMAAAAAGGAIALMAHGGKTAARAAVTPSPEPFSNIALSLGEDVVAISITWLATKHPYVAASIVVVLLLITLLMVRWVVRWLKTLFSLRKPAPGEMKL